jgi:hypothetical protein
MVNASKVIIRGNGEPSQRMLDFEELDAEIL